MNIFIKKKLTLLYLIFLFFIIFLIIEKLLCHENQYNLNVILNFSCHDSSINNLDLWSEGKLVENIQAILLFFSIVLLFSKSRKIKKKSPYIYYFLILNCVGLFYFLGEEISWGQHLFKWESPDIFFEYNIQKETNLHNISNLFNELPRTLVLIWCSFSVFSVILINRYSKINKRILLLVYPNKSLIFISSLLIIFILPDLIIDKFNLHPGHGLFDLKNFNQIISYTIGKEPPSFETFRLGVFYELVSFNFLRLSELHELIFAYYFFIYALTFREKIF
tara:strand:- start:51 stop:884 length:834 start_codon:yes stop_codon:yes gene_type:complete